jgi:hypothetical protein
MPGQRDGSAMARWPAAAHRQSKRMTARDPSFRGGWWRAIQAGVSVENPFAAAGVVYRACE